jgi:GxxExxY protein
MIAFVHLWQTKKQPLCTKENECIRAFVANKKKLFCTKENDCIHGKKKTIMEKIIYKEESFQIIGKCLEVYNNLGAGFLEIVYKDALELEFKNAGIPYEREKMYDVNYKGIILPHKFYADFVVYDKIILEVKGVSGIPDEFIAQAINYLKVSSNQLALVVNFGEMRLNYKRVVL